MTNQNTTVSAGELQYRRALQAMGGVSPLLLLLVLFIVSGCSAKVSSDTSLETVTEVQELTEGEPAAFVPDEPLRRKRSHLDEKILAEWEDQYGSSARQRLSEWEELIRTDRSSTDMEKLHKVNTFFNRLPFVEDIVQWGQQDYWATPMEFLASNGGDCEDFSLAKYFTLKAMGVNERRLFLTYVKDLNIDEFHMVVTYFEFPGSSPLILDNVVNDILPVHQRTNLLPVSSFNGSGLWGGKVNTLGPLVGRSDQLNRWKELLERMPDELK